jgi:uncharacterized protein YegJ (DUF2314 family)
MEANVTEPVYVLRDAEQQAAAAPLTFFIPPLETRLTFEPEDSVQLIFEIDAERPDGVTNERMWVEILDVPTPGVYVGSLDTHPIFIRGVRYGDTIHFEARHIIKFINEDGQPDI